jgi:hypothetical protein
VHAEDVDAEHPLEVFGGQVEEGFDLGDAGVGDPVGDVWLGFFWLRLGGWFGRLVKVMGRGDEHGVQRT